MSALRKPLLIALVALVGWYVAVVALWAARPLEDTIPTGIGADGRPAARTVECTSLFEGDARDDRPLPTPPRPEVYTRGACSAMHAEAQRVFVFDTVVFVLALGVVVALLVRTRRPDPDATPAPVRDQDPVATPT